MTHIATLRHSFKMYLVAAKKKFIYEEILSMGSDIKKDKSDEIASEVDSRLEKAERNSDGIALEVTGRDYSGGAYGTYSDNNEINLFELWAIIWSGKWWVIGITFVFALCGLAYAFSLPDLYKSKGIYAPVNQQGGSTLGSQFGGLAAMAGINFGGGESGDVDQAIAIITSWPFLEKVVNKNDLKPLIMGVKGWNRDTGELIWNDEIYDPVNKKWLREPSMGKQAEPSSYEVYVEFREMIKLDFDLKTSMLTVTVEHYSPVLARDWLETIVDDINEEFRTRDISEAKKSIGYLETKISETGIAEMQEVFYSMIESQMKTLMLAEVDEEYLFRVVVEPRVSEVKSAPSRIFILLLAVFVGAGVATGYVLAAAFVERKP